MSAWCKQSKHDERMTPGHLFITSAITRGATRGKNQQTHGILFKTAIVK